MTRYYVDILRVSLREKYKRVEHVHHEMELVTSASPRVPNYGSTASSTLTQDDEDEDDDETTQLLQFQLERAGAQIKGVSMIDFSSARPMPEAYRSMDNLASPRLHDLPSPDTLREWYAMHDTFFRDCLGI